MCLDPRISTLIKAPSEGCYTWQLVTPIYKPDYDLAALIYSNTADFALRRNTVAISSEILVFVRDLLSLMIQNQNCYFFFFFKQESIEMFSPTRVARAYRYRPLTLPERRE